MIDRISFIFGEAIAGIRRNVGMSLISMATAAIALFLLGGIYFLTRSLDAAAENLTGKFEMVAYLQEDATQADVYSTVKEIRAVPGVAKAVWIPKDKAWERQKSELKLQFSDSMLNPLPHAFKIILGDLKQADSVAKKVGALPKIDKKRGVDYMKDEQRTVEQGRSFLHWASGALAAVFFLVSGVLVFNTTRLAVQSRRSEIRIMRLIGAHWLTVDIPFLIEGIIFGAMGGVVATLLLMVAYTSVAGQLSGMSSGGQGLAFPYVGTMQALSLLGAAFGLVCAAMAIWIPERKPRR